LALVALVAKPVPAAATDVATAREGQARPAEVIPNNPCYDASCGPTQPVVVEYPTLGVGITHVHPDGQTNLWAVNASQAWAITKGDSSIYVAVLDTGVDPTQAQLGSKVVVGGNECIEDRPLCSGLYDQNGHGTFVTGLIAAAAGDGVGIAGLGWNTKVLDIKVLDSTGHGDIPDEVNGIRTALDASGVRVINLSWTDNACPSGTPASACTPDPQEQGAIESAVAHGVVVVAAAGGDNYPPSDEPVYPADYPGVLSVAAGTDQGVVDPVDGGPYEDFSAYGNTANIAAPGINVLSTWYDGNYAVLSGTSFAAPLVAAAAALVMAADPKLTGPQVDTLLVQNASSLGAGGESINGGFLNVGAAVQAAASRKVPPTLDGYQLVASNASAYNSGFVGDQGHAPGLHLTSPVVGGAETPGGLGYWMVTSSGQVVAVGGAHNYGPSLPAHFGQPIVGMAEAPDGRGYWLVGADGGVFAFGDAQKYAAVAHTRPSLPIVGMAPTPDGRGYWLVSSKGGVFAFGDAHNFGSTGKVHLNKPIVGMAATPDGEGYWLTASDGGIFNFGDAGYYGSEVGRDPGQPIVGMAVSPDGQGYWLAGKDGRVWDFGSARYEVGEPSTVPSAPITAITS
jgi:subtilisin family serine protease